MFGGNSTNSRRSRLLSASPYAAAAISSRKSHQRPLFEESTASSRRGSSAANSPSPAPSPSPSSTTSNDNGMMSSTARLIFDTLEKMSTPVRDFFCQNSHFENHNFGKIYNLKIIFLAKFTI